MPKNDLQTRWQRLNPVFVRGMQRSGTSIVALALRKMNIVGFGEGHLWYELLEPLEQLENETYKPHLRHDSYALGEGRISELEKYIGLALDQFHRDHISAPFKRWMDKSPGVNAVRIVPVLARVFPKAQFLFLYRNGVTCTHSAIQHWETQPGIFDFELFCDAWAATMRTWRGVRDRVSGRYLEIAQEDIASRPEETAELLTTFLQRPDSSASIANLFSSRRTNTSFPDRSPGDYCYEVDWNERQRAYFVKTCGTEMETWGYTVDFG
jgi:hypothetical protein